MSPLKKVLIQYWGYRHRLDELRRMDTFTINQERLIYHCPLTEKKRKNIARQAINRNLLKYREIAYPHILHVGVTTHCNLHCPACPTGTKSLGRPAEHMDFGLYRRTVDALSDSLLFMLFWDWGEPLLHPHLPEMISYAADNQIRTVISTNGTAGNTQKRIESLVAAGPSTIIVCVDGADQDTYQTYRKGGKLEKVLQTIRLLSETRQRLGVSNPLIEFRSLATKRSESQLPELLKLAQDSGADLFTVKTLRPYNYRGINVDDILVPGQEHLSRYDYSEGERKASARKDFTSQGELYCAKPLYAPTLNSDGSLAFCSYAQNETEFFGNLTETRFDQVWRNAHSRSLRINFQQAGGTISCQECFFRNKHKPTIIHQVPLRPLPDYIEVEMPQSVESFLEEVKHYSG